ncbi:MAG: hypothetical protein R2800_02030 [Flavipsychrobacter sp.]
MMKKPLKGIVLLYLLSVAITGALYIIDSDPPYANHWHTYGEFILLSFLVMAMLTTIGGVAGMLYRLVMKVVLRR